MYTFDTNALIYYFESQPGITQFIKENKTTIFYVPAVVVLEFLAYPLTNANSEQIFLELLKDTVIVNLDLEIAKTGAYLRRQYRLKTVDSIVAASSLATNSTLVTYNIRDFGKIRELQSISP